MSAQHKTFQIACQNNILAGTITHPDTQPDLKPSFLILHGAGDSNQQRSTYLAEHLANHHNLATLRFDHSGHGQSTGHIRHSSIARKLAEAEAMIPFLRPPVSIMGSSMGAHIGVLMSQRVATRNLILVAPAAFGKNATTIPFGQEFNFLTTVPGYWRNSSVWQALEQYTGKMLLITAGQEERVPPEITSLYWQHAGRAKRTQLRFSQSPHSIQQWLSKNPPLQETFLRNVSDFLLEGESA